MTIISKKTSARAFSTDWDCASWFSSFSEGTGEHIEGTGRFKGIQGNLSFKAKLLKPYAGESKGDALVEATGTYTLPPN